MTRHAGLPAHVSPERAASIAGKNHAVAAALGIGVPLLCCLALAVGGELAMAARKAGTGFLASPQRAELVWKGLLMTATFGGMAASTAYVGAWRRALAPFGVLAVFVCVGGAFFESLEIGLILGGMPAILMGGYQNLTIRACRRWLTANLAAPKRAVTQGNRRNVGKRKV